MPEISHLTALQPLVLSDLSELSWAAAAVPGSPSEQNSSWSPSCDTQRTSDDDDDDDDGGWADTPSHSALPSTLEKMHQSM